MATTDNSGKRNHVGFGTTYKKGEESDLGKQDGINAVLGNQVWVIKPDKKTKIKNPCLWMQAGVIKTKDCTNYYDCTTCKYDKGMVKAVAKGKKISWQDAMRKRPALDRVCRHSLTNRIAKRACAYDYLCESCDFDQYFEEVYTQKIRSSFGSVQQIKGFDVPDNYYFHNGHAWARIESGGNIRIGLDDFALKVLGKADAFELPLMGKELDQGKAGWGLKRDDHTADVLSPVDGVIMEVNYKVGQNPDTANRDPFGDGWLFTVRNPNLKSTLENLMIDAQSFDWLNSEITQLENMIEEVAGPMATDGGFIQPDVFANVPDLKWNSLTKMFLKSE